MPRVRVEPTLADDQIRDEILLVILELHAGHRTVPGELPGVVADELNGARVHAVVAVGMLHRFRRRSRDGLVARSRATGETSPLARR